MSAVLDALHARRSVSPRRMETGAPGPSLEQIRAIVDAGCAAPDHGLLRPWRFIYIPTGLRETLGERFAAAEKEIRPEASAEHLATTRMKGIWGSETIALIARIEPERDHISETDQWLSVGAAMQNMHLAAESFGWRAMVISGPRLESQTLRAAFKLAPEERLVGFLVMGTPAVPFPQPPRPTSAEKLTIWEG
ncbi:nitroreductase family protein [Neomegalonema perideroedes]|uniref:nitroreductase family protein n=1 Tax=Neomegalonema perideroedes TaxID=217219 RepID=UPI0003618848|nr:nitroreductase family protein [Neomegalonema perideroedes]